MLYQPHSDKQELAIFSEARITVCGTGIQWGKGLPLNELVLTPDGYREARMIEPGDTLYDRQGMPTKVIGVYPQGVRPCYKISFTDGSDLITDDTHLNVVIPRPGRRERVMSTRELFEAKCLWGVKRRGAISARIPATKPIAMPSGSFVIEPYVLGVLLGDGGITGTVIISSADEEILERVRSELPKELHLIKKSGIDHCDYGIVNITRQTDKNGYGVNRYIDELRRLGLFGCKSNSKYIPHEYKFSSIDQRLALLRGLMDTDGCVEKNKRMEFYSVSRQLAEDVVWLVESLGGKAWIKIKKAPLYFHKGERRRGQDCYRLNIILKGFNPFHLSRKASQYFVHENTEDKVIASVEPVPATSTVCFSVDSPTKTYIARGQIVTHNTDVGAWRTKIAMHEHTHRDDNFLVLAPSYKIMKQSSLPAFLKLMDGFGKYNKSDAVFEMYGGGTCWMRTATDPDSIVGMRNVRHIWGDEAGLFSLYFWENIQARAAPREAPIVLTTSPYSLNWVYKELIRGVLKGERPDVCYIKARSDENPYFPKAEFERRRATMDERRFRMVFGGEFEKMEGLVYDCFSEEENLCEWPDATDDLYFYAGVDWGYTEPFAMTVHGIAKDGRRYQVSEVKKSRLTLTDMIDVCRQKIKVFGVRHFFCDPSQPGYIEELNRAGIPASPANNDIKHGVAKVYEEIKSRRLKFVRNNNPHTIDEIETYHYPDPKDEQPDKSIKEENPVGQNDHCLDALRYLVVSTLDMVAVRAPFIPGQKEITNNAERIERLLRKQNHNQTVF